MIELTNTPLQAVPQYNGLPVDDYKSELLAAHNPIRVKGCRKDFEVKNTTDDGSGYVKIILQTPFPANVTVNEPIYINSESVNGVYVVTAWNGTDEITINLFWTVNTSNGYMNLLYDYANYYIRVVCEAVDPNANFSTPISNIITPFSDGTFEFDFSPYAKTQVRNTDPPSDLNTNRFWASADYTKTLFGTFYENYNDQEFEDTLVVFQCRIVNAAMSPYHYGGCNMMECYAGGAFGGNRQARFLMPSAKQRYYRDADFQEFITKWDPKGTIVANDLWSIRLKTYNKAGGLIAQTALGCNNIGYGTSNGYIDYPHFLNLSVLPINVSNLNIDYFGLAVKDPSTSNTYSEELIFRITCLPRNPVYIRALNYYGSFTYMVFGVNQIKALSTKRGTTFTALNDNVQVIHNDDRILSKDNQIELTLGSDELDKDDLINLNAILSSPYVQIWSSWTDYAGTFDPTPMSFWQNVQIVDGSFAMGNTKTSGNSKIEIKIITNSVNVQTS